MAGQLLGRQTDQDLGRVRRKVREDHLRTQAGHQRRGLVKRFEAPGVGFRRQDPQNLGTQFWKVFEDAEGSQQLRLLLQLQPAVEPGGVGVV